MDQALPSAIGKYEILSVIGRGGMGVVYRAQDRLMGRQVAIKTVTQGFSSDPAMLQRFYGEAEKMGMLRHPNIITVYDLGEHDGAPFIVMEYVEGDPLDRLIENGQSIPLFFKLRIIEQVCNALAYAHQNDVVHRDVKPANVIVRPDGVAKLLDFGIAKMDSKEFVDRSLTATGGVIGTVPYMAPERLRGAPFDGRSDIFAVGVLLFQLLTGRLPFTGTEYVLVNQLLNEQHPPLREFLSEYPPGLDAILDRSLAKDPSDRYQSADEMGADLYPILETLRHEYSAQLMAEAERLAATEDYIAAQNVLFTLLKADTKNMQARAFNKRLTTQITQRAREVKAQQCRRDAQEALRNKNFDQALELFEEAIRVTPEDAALLAERNSARSLRDTNRQILEYMQQADAARRSGNYPGARAILEKAIQLDSKNTRLRQVYESLVRQAEDAARIAKFRQLLESSREALRSCDYARALDLIEQARPLDPQNLELDELRTAARKAMAQQHRQRLLDDLQEQLASVSTLEDAQRIEQLVTSALNTMPDDPILLRHKGQVESLVREFETRRKVDEAIRESLGKLDASPLQALDIVRTALAEVPGQPKLLALEGRIRHRIEQMSAEEARGAVLAEARDAMGKRQFGQAASVLERCPPALLTPEITELLEYARTEAREQERQQLIQRCCSEAETLLRAERYQEVVQLLAPMAEADHDTAIHNLLVDAQRALERRNAEHARALREVQQFTQTGCYEQAIAFIDSMPARLSGSPEVQAARAAAQADWAREWARLEELGRAYAALASGQLATVSFEGQEAPAISPLNGLGKAFMVRRTAEADRVLSAQLKEASASPPTGVQRAPGPQIERGRALLPFASDPVRTEWTAMADLYTKSNRMQRVFSRLAIRGKTS